MVPLSAQRPNRSRPLRQGPPDQLGLCGKSGPVPTLWPWLATKLTQAPPSMNECPAPSVWFAHPPSPHWSALLGGFAVVFGGSTANAIAGAASPTTIAVPKALKAMGADPSEGRQAASGSRTPSEYRDS